MSRHLPTQRGHAPVSSSTPSLKPSLPSHAPPAVKAGTQGGGQALDSRTNAEMSAKFGHNFSQIRIHTDARAGEAAGAMGANAYALGGDIVFGAGKYNPGSRETDRLLAHELTHVVQQSRFGLGDWGRMSGKSDASEREADGLASQVMMGRSVQVQTAPGAAVARDNDGDALAGEALDAGLSSSRGAGGGGVPLMDDGTWPAVHYTGEGPIDSTPSGPGQAAGRAAGGLVGTEPGFGSNLAHTSGSLISSTGNLEGMGVAGGIAAIGGLPGYLYGMAGLSEAVLGGAVGGAVSSAEHISTGTSYGKGITDFSLEAGHQAALDGYAERDWAANGGAKAGSAVSNGANGVANWVEDLGQ